jgi:hypothetical protein
MAAVVVLVAARLLPLPGFLLGGMYEFWRTGRVTRLEFLVVGSGIAAALCSHKPRPFWFLLGTGFGWYLIERKISVCTALVAHTTTRAISSRAISY